MQSNLAVKKHKLSASGPSCRRLLRQIF
jgi:hypothetical protein